MVESQRWTFFGRVLPNNVPITLGVPLRGGAQVNDAYSLGCEFEVRLHLGQLVVDANFSGQDLHLETMRNFIREQAEHLVALIGYKFGGTFDVEILAASREGTNDWAVFGNEIGCLVNARPDRFAPLQVDLFQAVLTNQYACLVLSDFQRAMREDTGFYCYRAIESMMQSVKQDHGLTEKPAWARLRNDLKISQDSIYRVKDFADPVRHGKTKGMSDDDRAEILSTTDKIIDRFLRYLLSGRQPLSA